MKQVGMFPVITLNTTRCLIEGTTFHLLGQVYCRYCDDRLYSCNDYPWGAFEEHLNTLLYMRRAYKIDDNTYYMCCGNCKDKLEIEAVCPL